MKFEKLKEQARETRVFQARVWISVAAMVLLCGVLIGRLIYLQLVHHDHYTTLSQENRLKIVPIPPTRGLIYSADGVLLADNRPSFGLEVVPEHAGDLDAALVELGKILPLDEDTLARFRIELGRKRRFDTVPVKDNLTPEEVAKVPSPTIEFGIIAGGSDGGKGEGYNPLLPGDDDGVVSVDEAKLDGAKDFLVLKALHSFIMDADDTREAVLRFLSRGRFTAN